jgi:hypothetical protein
MDRGELPIGGVAALHDHSQGCIELNTRLRMKFRVQEKGLCISITRKVEPQVPPLRSG